jgi:20S proteasome subunit alpha 6
MGKSMLMVRLSLWIASLDELIVHGLQALRDTLQQDKVVNTENASIGYVGVDSKFTIVEGDDLQR